MALKGNLRDFTLLQLFNLVNLAVKTGSLIVETADDKAQLAFRVGKLAYASLEKDDSSLAGILMRGNKINASQYRIIRERGTQIADQELGLLMINAGYFSQDDILSMLHDYYIGVVHKLFAWMEGSFYFDENQTTPEGRIPVRIDLENLIIDATRMTYEREMLEDEIPSLDMAVKFSDRPGANLEKIRLNPEEWKVVNYVNPKNTLRQISRTLHLSEMEIRRIIYALLQAGIVELIRPAGIPIAVSVGSQTTPAPVVLKPQLSLVNRIINRIRSL
ncbi:MAG: DUF4388 domain-containing protein [Anaerolineaceae bacterium]|nr:DUF4388 domain-containing protein [Anaerolineaceae bacterium]MBN2676679.1 DUF4388 domain-containing protein [Anaerolineaceae bacterium]